MNCAGFAPQKATIKIDARQKFQTISGWEATAQAGENNSAAFEKYKDELFEKVVHDLGVNRLRLEIRSGAENPSDFFSEWQAGRIKERDYDARRHEVINDNDDPFVINEKGFQFSELDSKIEKVILPVKRLLAKRGEDLYLNLNFVDFGKNRGASNMRHNDNAEEYAELMLAAFQHINNKYDFTPDAIDVVLEPDNKTGWTGKQIGKAIVATAKRLNAAGFKPEFITPGTTNAANAPVFIDEIAGVQGAMERISEFSYHRYCCASQVVLRRITDRADKYGKRTAMLEKIGADYETLHEDLKIGKNSAWQQYTLAFPNQPDNGAQYFLIDDKSAENTVIRPGKRTGFLRQYFRYIRAGAQRVGAESSNQSFDPLAFINKNGDYVLVIKSAAAGTFQIENLPAGTYGVSYATGDKTNESGPDVNIEKNEPLETSIPAAGVLTVYRKNH